MKTSLARPASLLALSLVLLSGCADVLDEPGNLPPPVDLGSSSGGTPLNGIPTRAQLAGSWRLMRANGSDVSGHQKITLSFFTDLSYIVGGEANDPGCTNGQGSYANEDSNGDGVEFGELNYSESTGHAVASTPFLDSNGDCGFHETGAGATQDPFRLRFINGVLQLTDIATGNTYDFEAIVRGSGIVGSWYLVQQDSDIAVGPHPLVVSFFADGRYVLLTAEPQDAPGGEDDPGAQVGQYSIGAGNSLIVSNITTDSSKGGFDPSNSSGEKLFVTSSGQLRYEYTEAGMPHFALANPLPLAPRFNPAQALGTWVTDDNDNGNLADEIEPTLVSFFADGHYLLGGLNDDPGCVNDYSGTGVAVEPNGNGYETGSYQIDATTGRVRVSGINESDGSCGINDRTLADQRLYVNALSVTRLQVTSASHRYPDADTTALRPVPSSAGSLFGVWRGLSATTAAEEDFVLAYLDDSTAGPASGLYLAVDARPGGSCSTSDPGPVGGISLGNYLFNSGSGVIDYGASDETLCQTRFNPGGTQTLSFAPDGLRYTDNQASSPPASFSYNKLSRP